MLPKLNVLLSYAYFRKDPFLTELMVALSGNMNVMVDSGAYTVDIAERKAKLSGDTSFEPITLEAYISFCKRIDSSAWGYVMLDRLGDPVTTRRNLDTMLDAGLKPMPVFVRGDGLEEVERLAAVCDGRMCVGGAVDARYSYTIQRYQQVYEASNGKAKIHALGFVHYPELFQIPVASADASSWCGGGQYAHISRFVHGVGFTLLKRQKMHLDNEASRATMLHLLDCNITPEQLRDPDTYNHTTSIPALTTINSYVAFHRFATNHDRRFFFAIPALDWFKRLVAVASTHRPDGTFNYPLARERMHVLSRKVTPRKIDALVPAILSMLGETTAC